ncbi:MAG: carboxymuconolactone decarboxylase family protein [Alphaproteobacteria bacterium]
MTETLPPALAVFIEKDPEVWGAYQGLGKACSEAGPLDARTRRLVKLALAVGGGSEGAVHSHVRRGLDEGLSPQELRHVAVLAIPTLGFPAAVAALTWIADIVGKREGS